MPRGRQSGHCLVNACDQRNQAIRNSVLGFVHSNGTLVVSDQCYQSAISVLMLIMRMSRVRTSRERHPCTYQCAPPLAETSWTNQVRHTASQYVVRAFQAGSIWNVIFVRMDDRKLSESRQSPVSVFWQNPTSFSALQKLPCTFVALWSRCSCTIRSYH